MQKSIERLALSPALQKRLVCALKTIRAQIDGPVTSLRLPGYYALDEKHQQRLLDAYCAALMPSEDTDYAAFKLTPPSQQEKEECIKIASALIDAVTAKGAPAAIIDGFPTDVDLNRLALMGLSASLNSGNKPNSAEHDTLIASRLSYDGRSGQELIDHAQSDMHIDGSVGNGSTQSPKIRVLAGCEHGSNPLPTNVASIEEMIDAITLEIWPQQTVHQCATSEELKTKVIDLLMQPIWQELPLAHSGNTPITTRALIFANPHHTQFPEAPAYGIYTHILGHLNQSNGSETSLDSKFRYLVENAFEKARTVTLKATADGEALKAGQVLIFNNQFVLHGPGNFREAQTTLPATRSMGSLTFHNGLPTLETALYPGAAALTCAIPKGKVKTAAIQLD